MSHRLAIAVGLPPEARRAPRSRDVVRFHEPTVGALARAKGSLLLLAEVRGGDGRLERALREALAQIELDYYYDLSAGPLGALRRALQNANRRLYHARRRLGIPGRGRVSIIALALREREALVARVGSAAAVLVRGGRVYELPPSAADAEQSIGDEDRDSAEVPRTIGEAVAVEPSVWQGVVAAGDRLALLSRNLARTVGPAALREALAAPRPGEAVEQLGDAFATRGGDASDGRAVVELGDATWSAVVHPPRPVRPAEPLAGAPHRGPLPFVDAMASAFRTSHAVIGTARRRLARGAAVVSSSVSVILPRRRQMYPRTITRTDARAERWRRRVGLLGAGGTAAVLAVGAAVAWPPGPSPTEAIPRAAAAREAVLVARELTVRVKERAGGVPLIERDASAAEDLLADASAELARAAEAGVARAELSGMQRRIDEHFDALYAVSRIQAVEPIVDLASLFDGLRATDMAPASDGSLWILDEGRGRVVRVVPGEGTAEIVYSAGQALEGGEAGEPWLIATAATDVVVVDRGRQAWRIDLTERVPRRTTLAGIDALAGSTRLVAALQHRPPLEIFNVYAVDGRSGEMLKWTPPPIIPVEFPAAPEPYLLEAPDLPAQRARDLHVDTDVWLLHPRTVTLVRFGTPRSQADYSLERPPDGAARPALDYRLLEAATVAGRELLYVYDAANARLLGFARADGSFVGQWLAAPDGAAAAILERVVGLAVPSVAEGPAVAYLLTPERIVRVVLD